MNVTITPRRLAGSITPPPSKSQAHRLIIAAALGEGESLLHNVACSQDIAATIRCMAELGAGFERQGDTLRITGMRAGPRSPLRRLAAPRLDCGESGSTLRFLMPVALAVRGGGRFTGRGRLMERPQEPYFELFREKGISCEYQDGALVLSGRLAPGVCRLRGDVSSQFITGLLYALPLLDGDSEIVITTALESRDYVALTVDVLKRFGIEATPSARGWRVPGGQAYRACERTVEADWSQAAFWYAASGIGSDVEVTGMDLDSAQGDKMVLDWGRMLRGEPLNGGERVPILGRTAPETPVRTEQAGGRSRVEIDVSCAPDLVPPMAAWGALAGNTDLCLKNAARLRMKESDRLSAVTEVLTALGARVTETADSLTIFGREELSGGVTVDSHNDHRIAMMAAIAATRCRRSVTIAGAECVAKSYPDFWEDYKSLGGDIT